MANGAVGQRTSSSILLSAFSRCFICAMTPAWRLFFLFSSEEFFAGLYLSSISCMCARSFCCASYLRFWLT